MIRGRLTRVAEPWSAADEVDLTIETYFAMLRLEADGEAYSKADFRRDLRTQSSGRTGRSSTRLQNISERSWPSLAGLHRRLQTCPQCPAASPGACDRPFRWRKRVRQRMIRAADAPAPDADVGAGDPVEAPRTAWKTRRRVEDRVGKIIDFQERRGATRALGLAGEETVLRHERRRPDRRWGGGARQTRAPRFRARRGRSGLRRSLVHAGWRGTLHRGQDDAVLEGDSVLRVSQRGGLLGG